MSSWCDCVDSSLVSVDTLIRGKSSGERNIALIDDLSYVSKAANKLQDLLDVVLNYVDEVIVSIQCQVLMSHDSTNLHSCRFILVTKSIWDGEEGEGWYGEMAFVFAVDIFFFFV